MADRLNVTFSLKATDAADSSKFADTQLDWYDLPYEDFVQFQALLVEVAAKMQAWGVESAKVKGPKAHNSSKGQKG